MGRAAGWTRYLMYGIAAKSAMAQAPGPTGNVLISPTRITRLEVTQESWQDGYTLSWHSTSPVYLEALTSYPVDEGLEEVGDGGISLAVSSPPAWLHDRGVLGRFGATFGDVGMWEVHLRQVLWY